MPLSAGQRLGPYEIVSRIGAGGMGEVWRARDTTIGRDVAIKIIAPAFARDAERIRRFEQEARAAGQINHPNILTIYAVGREADAPYLVSELLHGQTLRDRMRQGALPPAKAVEYAIQIAYGLAAAHDRHIVHRDLKPDNLFLTTDDRIKILDFGIAKLTGPPGDENDPTRTGTGTGAILGTAGYMSPEQVRGLTVDERSDLFAFGAVLYEMLAGRRAFTGDSPAETMRAILEKEPPPLEGVAASLERAVRRALDKRPAGRFQSAHDLAFHLETMREPAMAAAATPVEPHGSTARRAWRVLPWVWAAGASVVALWLALSSPLEERTSSAGLPLRRFSISMADAPLSALERPPLAISPDGRRLAFVTGRKGASQIVLRNLDELSARPMPGTENGLAPFFSPDGEHLGFFTSDGLMRIAVAGGPPTRLTGTPPVTRGGVWSTDGWIYFAPSQSAGIVRIRADGGNSEPVTEPAGAGHVWPDVSADGSMLVYVERHGDSYDTARIVVRSLGTGEQRVLVEGGTFARFAGTDRLIYARAETLFVAAFDAASLALVGPPKPFIDGVQADPLFGFARYSLARDGTLAYVPGDARPVGRTLLWVTRSGTEVKAFPEERPFLMPAVSPDGTSIAVTIEGMHQDLWRIDSGRPVLVRLTASPGEDFGPVWSPDGRELAFTSVRAGRSPALFVKPAHAPDTETAVPGAEGMIPSAWADDGRAVITTATERIDGRRQMQLVPVRNRAAFAAVAPSRFDRYAATVATAGKRVAFVSLETGRAEVFVASWPDTADARQASVGGGTSPVWARDGRTLFYRSGDALFAVDMSPVVGGQLPAPRMLFRGQFEEPGRPDWPRNYDVAPDGRFLMIRQTYTPVVRDVVLLLNWRGEIPAAPVR